MVAGLLSCALLPMACNLDTTGQGTANTASVPGGQTGSSSGLGPGTSTMDPGVGTADGTGQDITSNGATTTTSSDATMTGMTGMTGTTATDEASGTDADTGPCVEQPWYPDMDRDGFGDPGRSMLACDAPPGHTELAGDCDDGDGAINPDADEVCNGQDDDCDEIVDEGSAQNASCNGCQFVLAADGSRYFAVCGDASTWDDARDSCLAAFGPSAQLALIDSDADQNALLVLAGGADHWLSLNDLGEEGVWRWHDDSLAYMNGPVGYDGWRPDQPVFGNGERCGELDAGGWADAGCTQIQPRICEHPI